VFCDLAIDRLFAACTLQRSHDPTSGDPADPATWTCTTPGETIDDRAQPPETL
jgi:hypothetical protein